MSRFAGTYTDLMKLKFDLFQKMRDELRGQIIGDRELDRLRTFHARIARINTLLTKADRRSTPRPGQINWTTFMPLAS